MSIKPVMSFRGVFFGAIVLALMGVAALAFGERIVPSILTEMFTAAAAEAKANGGTDEATVKIPKEGRRTINAPIGVDFDGIIFGKGDLPLFGFQHLRTDKIFRFNGPTLLDVGSVNDFEPSWSPDGKKVVFVSLRDGPNPINYFTRQQYRNIYIMNADGTDQVRLAGSIYGAEYQPSYSHHTDPQDQRIVFAADYSWGGQASGIYSMDTYGNNQTLLTEGTECEPANQLARWKAKRQQLFPGAIFVNTPNYSPDDQFIIFGMGGEDGDNVYRINADGTGCTRIYTGMNSSIVASEPRYSPDGTKIALHHRDGFGIYNDTLRIINATTGAVLQDLVPIDGNMNGHYSGSHAWDPSGSETIVYAAGDMNPDNTREDQEIWTIDINSGFQTQHVVQGVSEGIRGIDWGVPSTVVPALSMRINQPHPILAATSTTGTVIRSTPAPEGGVTITLQVFNPTGPGQTPILNLPSTSVFIAEGQTQATFPIEAPLRTDYRALDIYANSPSPNFGQAQATVSVTPARPNLRAVSFTAPATADPGVSFNVSWTVENIGPVTTGSNGGTDKVYFSIDNVLDADDVEISNVSNGALLPGTSRTRNSTATIPGSRVPSSGQYFLIFRTNPNEVVNEGGQIANNEIARPIQINLADLVSENFVVPATVEPGVAYNVTWTARNQGGASTATQSTANIYYSTDNIAGNGDDLTVGTITTPILAAGASSNENTTINVPTVPIIPSGPAFLYLKMDANSIVSEGAAGGTGETNNINFQPITFDYRVADLQVTATTVPPSVDTGIAFSISWTTTNAGNKAAQTFSDSVYFSSDNIVNANDVHLGTFALTGGLAAGASAERTQSVTIPPSAISASGTYFVYVRTDSSSQVNEGVNENNNNRFQAIQVIYRIADLQVTATSVAPEVETDTQFQMSWTSSNTGTLDAGTFSDRVYYSPDNLVNANDVLLGTFALSGGIAAGQSVNRVQDVTIPTSAITATGDYYLYVRTDALTQVHEGSGENNNVRFQAVRVRRLLRPDLTITNITGPPTVFFDQTIQVQWTVTNSGQGPTNAPQWTDRLYIATSPTGAGGTTLKSTQSVSALNPGESYTASAIVKIPRGFNGSYYFVVRADVSGNLNEENTTNNLGSRPVQVNVPPLPDLIVESVNAPDESFGGQTVSIGYTVRNIGTADAGGRRDRIYFSRDTVLDTGEDRLVFTSDSIYGPAAGQTTNHISQNRVGIQEPPTYQLARVPSDMQGLWYVFVLADYSNDVYEFNSENNNTNRDTVEPGSPINVLVSPPDLVVPNQPTAPSTVASGTSFPVTFTVRNQGAFNAAPFLHHAVFLSTDQTFNPATDTRIGLIRDPDFFAPGAEHEITLNVSIQDCLANGNYYLFAVADSIGQQFEYDPMFDAEANNASPPRLIELSTFSPDLQVTNFSVPPITMPGQSVSVSWTVANLGGPTARNWFDRVYLRSTNPAIGTQHLGSFAHDGGLPAGGIYTESRSVTLPAFMEGEYFLSITSDVNDTVPECGAAESNNSTNSSNFIVQNNLPDLVIDSVTAPPTAVVGGSFNVQWTGRNTNQAMPANAPSWTDTVFLSTDQTISNSDYNIGSAVNNLILAGGQTYSKQLQVATGNIPAGTYYVLIYADTGSHIYESTGNSLPENNNLRASGQITLTAPAVDLSVGNVGITTPHHSGTFRDISWTVTNNGTSPTLATQWSDYVILSRDGVIDPSDITLGYRTRTSALGGSANYTATQSFFIPTGLTGDYSIFVITDRNNNVVENNNTNNTSLPLTINLTLPPPVELSITNITPPTTIGLGAFATFQWTVQNTGGNPLNGIWRDAVYLSRDQFWDASDVLAGVRDFNSQQTPVAANGGTYTSTTSFQVPPVEEGTYYVIVRTDSQNRLRESNEGNNVTTSVGTTTVTITQLQLNTPLNTQLGNGASMFFKYATEPAETLVFSLMTDKPARSNEAFTKFNTMVSRADYDFFSTRPGEGNQENVIDSTDSGNYYSMVRTDLIPESFTSSFRKAPDNTVDNKSQLGIPIDPQNITVQAKILPFSIRQVSPEIAGNAGYATLVIDGAKFQEGATLKLVSGANEIAPSKLRVYPSQIIAIFDLKAKVAGDYDIVVRNPNNETATLDDGFTIVNGGGAAEPRVSINGPGFSRGGRNRYTISFSNDGLNDKYLVPLIITLPTAYAYDLDESNHIGDMAEFMGVGAIPSEIPRHVDIEGTRVLMLFAPVMGSRKTVNVNLDVILPFGFSAFDITAFALPALEDWYDLAREGQQDALRRALSQSATLEEECASKRNKCFAEVARGLLFAAVTELLPADCVATAWKALLGVSDLVIGILVKGKDVGVWDAVGALGNLMAGALAGLATDCLLENIPWVKAAGYAILVGKAIYDIWDCWRQYQECLPPPPEKKRVAFPFSFDPNEKIGPSGYGGEKWVPARQPLEYRINFENLASATAPAQLVRVTDTLPPSLDLRTVRLKEIGFKQYRYVMPPNQSFYQSRVQLGEDLGNLQADILAGVDLVSNRVFWNIQAIDPNTSESPLDPFAGILPPNNANKDGEGYVIFTAEASSTFPNRTVISNSATIIFDQNEPIVTNSTSNLLDSVTPISQIAALPTTSDVPELALNVTGTDDNDGSGFAGNSLYYSADGGPYQLYVTVPGNTTMPFAGAWGKSYNFYSVGRDNAGNIEIPPSQPDATIRVLGGDTEGDVAPRPNGSDGSVNGDDLTQVRRFIAKLDSASQYNEFQRADMAPKADGGDGSLSVADVMQARRYVAGTDPIAGAVGPNEVLNLASKTIAGKSGNLLPREVKPITIIRHGNQIEVGIVLETQGDETGLGFGLNFDPAVLSNPVVNLRPIASGGTLTLNTAQVATGKLGVMLDKEPNQPFAAGSNVLMTIMFDIANGSPATTQISFDDDPIKREVVDGLANGLNTTFSPGTIQLLGPTAANVNVSGRVLKADGTPIKGARLILFGSQTGRSSALSNAFGYFTFIDVVVGQTYTMNVSARGYTFTPQSIMVTDEISGLEITPDP